MAGYWYPTAFTTWNEEETQAAIKRVLASGRLTMGEETFEFEKELAVYNKRKHAICVNSGSSANLIGIAALHHKRPIRTAVAPALAWSTTYAPLAQHGIKFKLLDCDASWNAQPYKGPPVDLLVGCSILGNPARFDLQEPDHYHWLFNDNCESLGAHIYNKPIGSYGDIATLSFYFSHQLSAVEGGAVLTDDDELADLCRMLRDHGMTRSFKKAETFEEEFDFKLFGYNVRTTDLYSAIGRVQLRHVDAQRPARRGNWYYFNERTSRLPITMAHCNPGFNPFGVQFILHDPRRRRELAYALRAESIDCRMPVGGSFRLATYGKDAYYDPTPNADKIHRSGMFLGVGTFEICDRIDKAVEIMKIVLS